MGKTSPIHYYGKMQRRIEVLRKGVQEKEGISNLKDLKEKGVFFKQFSVNCIEAELVL